MPPADDQLPELCPYCGEPVDPAAGATGTPRCRSCLAFLDALSREVTRGHMGPWYIRDATRPHYPGLAFDVLSTLVARGELTRDAVLRGPTTGQFWMRAIKTPGVAHLFGVCHACGGSATRGEERCRGCGASFVAPTDRDALGLVNTTPSRLSAFATDEELRDGAPGPLPVAVAKAAPAPGPTSLPRPAATSDAPSIREESLAVQVEEARKRNRFLMWLIGGLLLGDLILVVLVLRIILR